MTEKQLADLVILDRDFTTVEDKDIASLRAELTAVGRVSIYAAGDLEAHDAPALLLGKQSKWRNS